MQTILCLWDGTPEGYDPAAFERDVATTSAGSPARGRWSIGRRRHGMAPGDRVFLLRQHNQRGIVGAGRLVDGVVRREAHWRPDVQDQALYVDIDWDRILNVHDRLPLETLMEEVPGHQWRGIRSSGQIVHPPNDDQLERLWADHLSQLSTTAGAWDIEPGQTLGRAERVQRFGGGMYGGIEQSARTPNVFVYSDPAEGRAHGYFFDGWAEDDSVFLYTGEGATGDQRLTDGNAAMLNHSMDGRTLRLFVADGTEPGSSTKIQRYVGQFAVDSALPLVRTDSLGADKTLRSVLVFRLIPTGPTFRRTIDRSTAPSISATPNSNQVPVDAARYAAGSAEPVPIERFDVSAYTVAGSVGTTATKTESLLVERFVQQLADLGRTCSRYRIQPPHELRSLYTDVFDSTQNVLYEAKGVATREAIRLAIGQLLDYRRHIPTNPSIAVLVPVRPSDDLLQLLSGLSIRCVYETRLGSFEPADGGDL
ncbi:hypothetical protein ACVBEQ_05520 [Nakamurella sp. GG22]